MNDTNISMDFNINHVLDNRYTDSQSNINAGNEKKRETTQVSIKNAKLSFTLPSCAKPSLNILSPQ